MHDRRILTFFSVFPYFSDRTDNEQKHIIIQNRQNYYSLPCTVVPRYEIMYLILRSMSG